MAQVPREGGTITPADFYVVGSGGGYVTIQPAAGLTVDLQLPGAAGKGSDDEGILIANQPKVIGPLSAGTRITISASTAVIFPVDKIT